MSCRWKQPTGLVLSVSEEKPKDGFKKGLEDQHCLEGETVTLTCEVTKPKAKVKWLRAGKEIKPDGKKYEVVVEGTVHKLIIHDAKPDDQTEFSAKFGDETTRCHLVVDGTYFRLPASDFRQSQKEQVCT